jgi:hypothetical protein
MSIPAYDAARADWCDRLERSEREGGFARQWVSYLERNADTFSAALPGYFNLVVGTSTALSADAHFSDRGVSGTTSAACFDVLVLDEAHLFAEAELLQLAQRARRLVLVGEPAWEDGTDVESVSATMPGGKASASAISHPAAGARASAFQRLWNHLHCDPRRLPYTWMLDSEHLCCRLRTVPSEQRSWIESERVADSEDIELRILALPHSKPTLVEVVFPAQMPIELAKQYIFRELQELPVRASAHSLAWVEERDRVLLRLANCEVEHQAKIDLELGIREGLGFVRIPANGSGREQAVWQTCCMEFDRTAGWHRRRAEEWIEQHLGLRDWGRTARLNLLHRMEPDLATFVADMVHAEAAQPAAKHLTGMPSPDSNGRGSHLEFVAVPPTSRGGEHDSLVRRSNSSVPRKGGAGLELDLADPRQRDRLPAELRFDLPKAGWVNYAEAQAVVRTLSSLVADDNTVEQAESCAWASSQSPAIAVIALYPGQVDLIRRLIDRVPSLARARANLEVGFPEAFMHRDAGWVLLSLTRSHTHRAVSFGPSPHLLALAMTRARSRLILFGDPGTLLRRSQWEGPLDHLDQLSAARERDLIAQIVRHFFGQEVYSHSPSRQGSGP